MRHLDDGLLQAWLDRPRSGLEAGECDRIERHLASCEACAGRVADLRDSTRRTEWLLTPAEPADEPVPPYATVVARARRRGVVGRRRRAWIAAGWAASVAVALWGGWLAHDLIGPGPAERSADGTSSVAAGAAERAQLSEATDDGAPATEAADDESPAVEATDDRPETQVAQEAQEAPEDAPETRLRGAAGEQAPEARIAEIARLAEPADEPAAEPMERRREAVDAPVEAALTRAGGAPRPSIVQGRVTSESGRPLASVQVAVEGTSVGSVTGSDGRFTLNLGGLPDSVAREPTVTAVLIGYRSESRTPVLGRGDTASLDFRLPESAVALDELVVRGVEAEPASAPTVIPWSAAAPEPWLPMSRPDAESHLGFPLLMVPGLEVVTVEVASIGDVPVGRVVQELSGGERLTLVQVGSPVTLDGPPPVEDLVVAYTRRGHVWIAGTAPLPPDSLRALLERAR